LEEWQEICKNIFKYQLNVETVLIWFSNQPGGVAVAADLPPYMFIVDAGMVLQKTGCESWYESGVSLVIPFMSGTGVCSLVGLNLGYVLSKDDLEFVGFVARELQKNLQFIQSTETMRNLNMTEFVHKNEAMLLEKKLTEREIEIVSMLVQGFSNAQISEKIIVTESTTKRHIYNLFKKLEINSRFELLRWVNDRALEVS
jgi:DNA-binding CsgD family transcriptional regulator